MGSENRSNLVLGVFFVVFALGVVFLWVPMDTDSGMIEKVRRQVTIGDALAPTVAGVFILLGAVLLLVFERKAPEQPEFDPVSIAFATMVLGLLILSFLTMLFAGPLTVALVNALQGSELDYRLLRDTAPWKHIGFVLGGVLAIAGTISLTEGRFSPRALIAGVCAVLVMIAIFDLPFDDLLLPPNGDF
jgi:hypothetical protein